MNNPKDVADLITVAGKIKRIKRAGWVREEIKDSETVSDHSYGLAFLAMLLAPHLKIDQSKLMKMAMIHDLGEIKTGDVVTAKGGEVDYQIKEKKEREEKEFIRQMFKNHDELTSFFEEIIERKTKESKVLTELDRLEMAFQALEYEREQGKDLSEFFIDAKSVIKEPFLKEILGEIQKQRK